MGLSLSGISGASGILPPPTSGGSFDSDAQAFITAAGITNSTQQNAINNLVLGFKSNGTWAKYAAIYPLVGGTAFSHSLNLRDPRDLNAAFRVAWSGSITHDSTGVTGAGGFGNTFYNSIAFGLYSFVGPGPTNTNSAVITSFNASNNRIYIAPFGGITYVGINGTDRTRSNITTTQGYMCIQKTGSTTAAFSVGIPLGGQDIAEGTVPTHTTTNPVEFFRYSGSISTKNARYFAITSQNMTLVEVAADRATVLAYQTALGRLT